MANEVRISHTLSASLGAFKVDRTHTYSYDHPSVTNASIEPTISFTTSVVTIDDSTIPAGDVLIINLSTVGNFVYGPKDPSGPAIVPLGEVFPRRSNHVTISSSTGLTLKGQASAGTVKVQFIALNQTT